MATGTRRKAPQVPEGAIYTRKGMAEKLIALGRAILATLSLAGVWADPTTPARLAGTTYTLMLGYAVYALTVAAFAWSSRPSNRQKVVSHVFDLIVFTVFIYLTEGPVSPFFLYFVFSLFCAALRFRWRGILYTAVAATSIYVAMGVYVSVVLQDPLFDLDRFIIRTAYLVVAAALLVYLGAYHERLNEELASLASWPRTIAPSYADVLRDSLQSAAGILQAKRVVLLWEEDEEPWTYRAHWFDGELRLDRLPPGTYEPMVVPELEAQDFFHNERLLRPMSQFVSGDSLQQWHGAPAHADLIRDFGGGSFLSIRLESQKMGGRLFTFGSRELTHDDLVLGRIVAKLIVANIDQHAYLQEAQHSAGSEERFRISRDLHDGVIQSLGGVGLQLEAVRSLILEDPVAARRKLQEIQRVVENDQRELRAIVRELRPGEAAEMGSTLDLRLASLCQRFEHEWGAKIELETRELEQVSGSATMDIYRMVNEALANAVRHGKATAVRVNVTARDECVHVTIADNGRGFPFRGRYELSELESFGEGPRTLKERISSLGGSLVIESGTDGATVAAAFPMKEEIVGAD